MQHGWAKFVKDETYKMAKPENPEDFVHPADSALFMYGAGGSANSHRLARAREALEQVTLVPIAGGVAKLRLGWC